ncbi:hypothetical protein SRIMHP_26120 [Streptomyces rimosus subsp. rimosus]|nr:hypothetical protein SRIMR7_28745 [Streptomyces rimosus subsp. rimosus]UTH97598.1 hypothetical protein SRIMHP_26120 [Streptomyces rimosus subsp. rimosus]UTJ15696.1 hypothetical protein SRIMDV3_26020 [Streptomyces rimosus subsp. rimosus]
MPGLCGYPAVMSRRHRYGSSQAARAVTVVADLTAVILGLWIVMYLLDANRANDLVHFVQGGARWLAGWSYNLFTFDAEWLRTLLNYGLPALVYLVLGHALAARIRRIEH